MLSLGWSSLVAEEAEVFGEKGEKIKQQAKPSN
jgi:hypothetical protein